MIYDLTTDHLVGAEAYSKSDMAIAAGCGSPERETKISDAWEERVTMNPTITFVFDDSKIKPYVNAINTVLQDYVPMLELGLVDDVDATLLCGIHKKALWTIGYWFENQPKE